MFRAEASLLPITTLAKISSADKFRIMPIVPVFFFFACEISKISSADKFVLCK